MRSGPRKPGRIESCRPSELGTTTRCEILRGALADEPLGLRVGHVADLSLGAVIAPQRKPLELPVAEEPRLVRLAHRRRFDVGVGAECEGPTAPAGAKVERTADEPAIGLDGCVPVDAAV